MKGHKLYNPGCQLWFIGNLICPYSQRIQILLNDAGFPYKHTEVDFIITPDWVAELSPLQKIPVLVTDDCVLFESGAIIEYINDLTDQCYLPGNNKQRAFLRSWSLLADAIHGEVRAYFTAPTRKDLEIRYDNVQGLLDLLAHECGLRVFLEDKITLLGLYYGPLFVLLEALSEAGPFKFIAKDSPIFSIKEHVLNYPAVNSVNTATYRKTLMAFLLSANSAFANYHAEHSNPQLDGGEDVVKEVTQ